MNRRNYNIWEFQSSLSRRLLIWSFVSMVIGVILQTPRDRFTGGLGKQFAAWGLIDAMIAIFGERTAKKRATQLTDPLATNIMEHESRKLHTLLLINTGLDVGYIIGGTTLALTKGKNDPGWRGHGIGVIIQGAFLFFFDLIHTLKIEREFRE